MTIIATDTPRDSDLIKHEYEKSMNFSREMTEVADNSTLGFGKLLGKVTATGVWKESVATATDGSENPLRVVIDAKPIATDTKKVLTIARLAIVRDKALVFHSTFDTDAKKAKAYESLATQHILASTSL